VEQEPSYALFDAFPGLALVADAGGKILYSNPYTEQLLKGGLAGDLLKKQLAGPEPGLTQVAGLWFKCVRAPWRDITLYLGVDVTDIQLSSESFMITASTDSMTGIYNRAACLDSLKNYMKQARAGMTFSVSYFDINDLKYVNDTHGHALGDDYIQAVVTVVRESIRGTDIFARMGGDEFLVIFPQCHYAVVIDIMETIMRKLDVLNQSRRKAYQASVSYGVMEVSTETDLDLEYILNTVDRRMYAMKQEYKRRKASG
jgi:diguanylate cyclase (GGDEF)-like protein